MKKLTTETSGVGTRKAMPVNFPFKPGMTYVERCVCERFEKKKNVFCSTNIFLLHQRQLPHRSMQAQCFDRLHDQIAISCPLHQPFFE
jgi:hypothetical protein